MPRKGTQRTSDIPPDLSTLPVPLLICNTRTVRYANPAALKLFDSAKTSFPRPIGEMLGEDILAELRTLLRNSARGKKTVRLGSKLLSVLVRKHKNDERYSELYFSEVAAQDMNEAGAASRNDLFSSIVENSEEGISIVRDENFLFVNKKFLELFGYTRPDELIGKSITTVIADSDRKRVQSISKRRQRGRSAPYRYGFVGRRKDGVGVEIEVVVSRIRYDGRRANLGFHRDVTEQNRLEYRLLESEAFHKNVFSSIHQGVVVFDRKLRCIDWNAQMQYFTGIDAEDAVGKEANVLFKPIYDINILDKLNGVLKGAKASYGYLPYHQAVSKEIRYAWLHLSPLMDRSGDVDGVVGVLSDLTQQKYMQDEVKESETLFRNVLEAMGDALVLTDLQGKVVRVNKEFERISGYTEDEAVGQTIPYSWFYEEDTARFVLWVSELRERNYLRDFDIRWKRKDERITPVSLNTTLLRNKSGEPVAMLNIARDITERKKLETEIYDRTSQIELINRIIGKGNESIDIYDLLTETDRELRRVVRFDLFGVILLKDRMQFEEFRFRTPEGDPDAGRERIVSETTLLGVDFGRWKQIVAIDDSLSASKAYSERPVFKAGYRSLLAIPMYSKKNLLGVLYIARRSPSERIDGEIERLQPICEQIGLIVDKFNLFTKVSDDAQYIHNLLNSIDSIVFTVDSELRVTESNTTADLFPFSKPRSFTSRDKTLVGKSLYKVIAKAPYRTGIEQVVDALFSEQISIYTTEFSHRLGGEVKSYHLRITPLKIEGRIVGLVFNHTDITNLKRTEEELKRRNRDLIEVNELSAMIAKSLSVQEVYSITLNKILRLFDAHNVVVYLVGENHVELSGYAGRISSSDAAGVGKIPLSRSLTGELVKRGDAVLITSDLYNDPRTAEIWKPLIKRYNLQATVSVPLMVHKKVLGSLNLNFGHPRELTAQELQLLLLISNQLSAAIDNIRLYENLNARVSDLTVLASLGNIYASSLDIQKIANNVIDKLKKLRNPDVLSLLLFDQSSNTFTLAAALGIPESSLHLMYRIDDPALLTHVRANKEIIIDEPAVTQPEIHRLFLRPDQRSMGIFPLQIEGTLFGILSVGYISQRSFLPEDIVLYRNIANQLSMSIQSGQLYRQIQDSEEKYRLLVESAQDMVLSMDMQGIFRYVSPSSVTLTGYTPQEIENQRLSRLSIHPDDYDKINRLMRLAVNRKISPEPEKALEFRIRTKSGSYRWVSTSWTLAHDAHGEIAGIQCILRDVHARRLAEDERNQQMKRLRVLYELAHSLAATLDQREILSFVSGGVRKIIPFDNFSIYLHDSENPKQLSRILHLRRVERRIVEDHPALMQLDEAEFELERNVLVERRLLDRRGSAGRPCKSVAPMITKERVLGLIVVEDSHTASHTDIQKDLLQTIAHLTGIAVEKAILYEETVEKSTEIQRRNRELDDFTYVVSHDLKEPLISIEGYSKILTSDYRDEMREEGFELLQTITLSCNRMKNLINELLTLSRVGRLTENMAPVALRDVIAEVLEDLEFSLRSRRGRVVIEKELPVVKGNRVHLQVLFRNLISNGIKFNNSEHPVVRIRWEDNPDALVFSISDNGIGIPAEYFDKIFIIFQRLRHDKQYEGTGAGLTIVKKIVETHGGTIWLDSEPGNGTTFHFTLPKSE